MRILKKKGLSNWGKENLKIMSVSVHAYNPQLHKDKHMVYNNLYNLKIKLQVLITQTIISYPLTA